MRSSFFGLVAATLSTLAIGCGKTEDAPAPKPAADVEAPAATGGEAPAASGASASAKAEPFVEAPTAGPPPAPVGAELMNDPWLYVQTCEDERPCPDLTQTEGELHCEKLALGDRTQGWRLPSREEAERFASVEGLQKLEGYHWTRTPFDDDMMQVWIVDPKNAGPATTIPRKRKPFRIRCVYEP